MNNVVVIVIYEILQLSSSCLCCYDYPHNVCLGPVISDFSLPQEELECYCKSSASGSLCQENGDVYGGGFLILSLRPAWSYICMFPYHSLFPLHCSPASRAHLDTEGYCL